MFIGSCVSFDNEELLNEIVDNSEEITKEEFFEAIDVEDPKLLEDMEQYPYDFTFHRYNNYYYFRFSAIEYIFKAEPVFY